MYDTYQTFHMNIPVIFLHWQSGGISDNDDIYHFDIAKIERKHIDDTTALSEFLTWKHWHGIYK